MGEGAWPRSSGETQRLRPKFGGPLPSQWTQVSPGLQEDGHLEKECYNLLDFQVTREAGVEAEARGPGL